MILNEKHRLRAFENRVLRISEPKRRETACGWRKLLNEELHNLKTISHSFISGSTALSCPLASSSVP
jgi:hypothetical protein